MSKTITIGESTPTLKRWTDDIDDDGNNIIKAYIEDLKDVMADLSVLAADSKPWGGRPDSPEYLTLCRAILSAGLIVRELKEVRAEMSENISDE